MMTLIEKNACITSDLYILASLELLIQVAALAFDNNKNL